MKKALVFALALVMVLGMAIPASAATGSPTGTAEDLKPTVVTVTTTESELIVSATTDSYQVISTEEVEKLPEEAQEVFAEAKESLTEAAPEGMAVRYFFYFAVTAEDEEEQTYSVVFDLDDYTEVVFMQFVDGEWVELEFVVNEDGTITVLGVVDGPIAIFVKN